MKGERAGNLIGILGIMLSLISLFPSTESRIVFGVCLLIALFTYIIRSVIIEIGEVEQALEGIGEKLIIHEQLIELKASILDIQRRISQVKER